MAKLCPSNKYETAINLVESAPRQGVEALQDLAKKYPSDPYVRHALGVALSKIGHHGAALPQFEEATKRVRVGEDPSFHEALMVGYARLNMLVHSLRVARRLPPGYAPERLPDISEFQGTVPTGASEKDLLEYERARYELLYGSPSKGLASMTTFVKRYLGYQPGYNLLTTGYYTAGQMDKYAEAATEALGRAPDNIHALLNYARLKLLTEGSEAVEALLERIEAAPSDAASGIIDGDIAKAQAFSLINHDDGVGRTLGNWYDEHFGEDHPLIEKLNETLERREEGSKEPYVQLAELLIGVIGRWRKLNEKTLHRTAAADIAKMPGLLQLVPERLGFAEETFANLFVSLLLGTPTMPTPVGAWSEVLTRIAQEGPGKRLTRLALLRNLIERGIVKNDDTIPFEGIAEGIRFHQLEVYTEMRPNKMTAAEQEEGGRGLILMNTGQFAKARAIFERLSDKYPDDMTLEYNLAMSELYDPGLIGGEDLGDARLDGLIERYPHYLYPRIHRASEALERGDLKRARTLLALPQGLKRLHIDEYGAYACAAAQLAAHEGQFDTARNALEGLEETHGKESVPYKRLEETLRALQGSEK